MMRVVPCLLLTMFLSTFAVQKIEAAEGVVTPSRGPICQTLRSNREESIWRCPGPAGAFMEYVDFTMHAGLTFGVGKRVLKLVDTDDLGWSPNSSGLASRMEWRVNDGRPFAAIMGRWRQLDDGNPPFAFEELLVIQSMMSSRFAEEQIIGILKEHKAGVPSPICAASMVSATPQSQLGRPDDIPIGIRRPKPRHLAGVAAHFPRREAVRGVRPSQAAKRPLAKVSAGGASVAIAVVEIGPMPGTVISLRDTSSSRARRAISLSKSAILPLRPLTSIGTWSRPLREASWPSLLPRSNRQASPHATAPWVRSNHIQ